MTPSIRAIETRYAGCRFRSRLEARWAVFFDYLGISWQYEPQGFLVGPENTVPYLPDFWLPGCGIWVEVKGTEEALDIPLLVNAAIPHWGLDLTSAQMGDRSCAGPRLLILGPIPSMRVGVHRLWGKDLLAWPTHSALSFWKGDVEQVEMIFRPGEVAAEGRRGGVVGNDAGQIFWETRGTQWGNLIGGGLSLSDDKTDPAKANNVAAAYAAARSARFEHGENP